LLSEKVANKISITGVANYIRRLQDNILVALGLLNKSFN